MITVKLEGRGFAIAINRDVAAMAWRCRCFKPPFTLEAADNRTLVEMIDKKLDEEIGKDESLLEALDLKVVERIDDGKKDGKVHYEVPYRTTRV